MAVHTLQWENIIAIDLTSDREVLSTCMCPYRQINKRLPTITKIPDI